MPGAIAPLVAGWDRWRKGFSPPPASPLGGETPGAVKVELFIAEQWVDVTRLDRDTPGVYYRDNIVITRGKADEAATLDRGTCRFTLNNRDGRFSPRNPNSPYYGKLGRNTPVRVSVVQATGERRYRFHGEVSSWPQKWDLSGTDVFTPIEASGVLRRLGQGASPISSAFYRGTAYGDTTHLVAYWPCEDTAGSTTIGSALASVPAMNIAGTPTLASNSDFVASSPLPVMGSGSFTATIPTYSTSLGQNQASFLLSVPSGGATDGETICRLAMSGSTDYFELDYGVGGTLRFLGVYGGGIFHIAETGYVAFGLDGQPCVVSIALQQTTATVIGVSISVLNVSTSSVTTTSATGSSSSLGRINSVTMAPDRGLTNTALGHITVQNKISSLSDLSNLFAANSGEQAATRISRLCGEQGINFQRRLPAASSTAMGAQSITTLVSLINDCVAADMGRLFEPRDEVGFGYRDRRSLYNQTAVLALSYSDHELTGSLDPVDDDQYTRNDVTVSRTGGSSARVTRDTGALSIASVGRYATSVTLNVETDTRLTDLASWSLHLGTTDEARYPTIQLNLLHPTFTTSDAMTTAALSLDIGDLVTIDNPPAWLPPDQIALIVEGYTETIGGNGQHTITLNCSPASPYNVAVYANAVSPTADKYSPSPSTLVAGITSAQTALSVTVDTSGDGDTLGALWTTDVAEFPFDLVVGGERMTVTAISGSVSPQSFTVTRSVNGIVKAHPSGESVELFSPCYYDLGA